ncbi:MAG: hypothetical protein K0M40_03900 [Prolixibacteraceae bacterium]|nr:hypothetical protein [Prolixibacteraceae bacterium]
MLRLTYIYSNILKYYPEVSHPEIEQYCIESDKPKEYRTGNYLYGFNSLKWGLCMVNDIDPKAVRNVMRDIIFELIARGLQFALLETKIMTFSAMHPYKDHFNQRYTIPIDSLEHRVIGNYLFVINNHAQNLAGRIFSETEADAILFHNPLSHSAGIVFRNSSQINKLNELKDYLFKSFSAIEPGWITIGEDKTLIINHGHANLSPSSIQIPELIQIIENYSWDLMIQNQ